MGPGALSGPRRQRMHTLAAHAIESDHGSDDDARIAAVAVHYRLAGRAGDPAKAIEYSLRAGQHARQLFAWDEAVAHWDGAVALMDRGDAAPAERAGSPGDSAIPTAQPFFERLFDRSYAGETAYR